MLTAALILSIINATTQYPPLVYTPTLQAIQPTTGSFLTSLPSPPCTWTANPPEGELLAMVSSAGWSTVCRETPPFTSINTSTSLTYAVYSTATSSWSTVPLRIPPFTSLQGVRLRITSNAQATWLLVTTPAAGSPATGGGGTAGNGGGQLSSIYAIPADVAQPTTMVWNSTDWVVWDIEVSPSGLYAMAQTSSIPSAGGVTLLQSAILHWSVPPLFPDRSGIMRVLPGTLQTRYLQAFLAPTPRSPLVILPSSYPYILEVWTLTSNGVWGINQTMTLTKLAGQPLQIIPAEQVSLGYIITSGRSIVVVQFPSTEYTLVQLPSSPPLAFRSIVRSGIDSSPSPSSSSISSMTTTISISSSASATSSPRYLRSTDSATSTASTSATPSSTSILVPVYYTPSFAYTWSSTPTPSNAPTWPSPTPTFTPTSQSHRTPSQTFTQTPSPTNSSWGPESPAANINTLPTLTPGEIAGLSIPLLLLGGAVVALTWIFRNRVKNYMLARGWRKSIPRFSLRSSTQSTQRQTQSNRAPRPRPTSLRTQINATGNPVLVSNPTFRSSLTQEQKDLIQAARVERTKKAFEPMKSQGALV